MGPPFWKVRRKTVVIVSLLFAEHLLSRLGRIAIISLELYNALVLIFPDEETEAQKGSVTCTRDRTKCFW